MVRIEKSLPPRSSTYKRPFSGINTSERSHDPDRFMGVPALLTGLAAPNHSCPLMFLTDFASLHCAQTNA